MTPGIGFRLAGIPVRVEITFAVMAVLLGLVGREGISLVGWVVAVFVAILVHELGHAGTLRAFGQRPRVLLHGWGGLTYPSGPLPPGRSVVVSLAGSVTAIVVLGIPALLIHEQISVTSLGWRVFWADLAWVALGWSIINLLPILPLDGGNVARTLLAQRLGDRGQAVALWLSIGTCSLGAAWSLARGQPYIALWFGFFASYSGGRLSDRRDAPLLNQLRAAFERLEGEPGQAAAVARDVMARARGSGVRTRAAEVLAWAELAAGEDAAATEAIRLLPPGAPLSEWIRACVALVSGDRADGVRRFAAGLVGPPVTSPGRTAMRCVSRTTASDEVLELVLEPRSEDGFKAGLVLTAGMHGVGDYAAAARAGERLFAEGRADRALVAYNVACSLARSGQLDLSLRWLHLAVANGFADSGQLEGDEDLDPIRSLEGFAAIRASVAATG